MKKIFAVLMALSVLGAFIAGCSKPAEEGGETTTPPAAEKTE